MPAIMRDGGHDGAGDQASADSALEISPSSGYAQPLTVKEALIE
jgi:hypothetical protein